MQALGVMDSAKRTECWASIRRECSDKKSREHVISRALLSATSVLVEGFDWCKEPKRVGVESLTRKILCTKHNSELSSADEAIAKLNIAATRQEAVGPVSGRSLEHWFLKTLVGLSIGTDDHIGEGMNESEAGWPSSYVVNVVFGQLRLTHRMGLYTLQCPEPYKYREGEILFIPLTRQKQIGGALFGIAGIYFFFSLNPGRAPTTLDEMAPNGEFPLHVRAAQMVHRPIWIEFAGREGNVARLDIDWSAA